MLSERCYRLLTAYVDGELSARQRKLALRLLHRSAEARALLRRLRQDAEALRRLPRHGLPAEFSAQVVQSIRDRKLERRRRLARTAPPAVPAWVGMAVAASVLAVVGFGSFVYFSRALPDHPTNPVAVNHVPQGPEKPVEANPAPDKPAEPAVPVKNAAAPDPKPQPHPGPIEVADGPKEPPKPAPATNAEPNPENALTLPIPEKEMFQPRTADVSLPLILSFADLDTAKLQEELHKASGFRLEVPCRESSRAFDRLQAALKANGVGLVIDQTAQFRLKYPKLRTNYVVYTEDLLPDELVKVLQQAGGEDHKADVKHHGDGQLAGLVVTRMNKDDRKELSTLLGGDSHTGQNPRPTGPLGLDPKKPVSEGTADQVAKSLAGQGSAPRPSPGQPAVKPPEYMALVLPYNPVRPRPGSAEVKHFLDGRKPARPGAIQVLLVLRETKG